MAAVAFLDELSDVVSTAIRDATDPPCRSLPSVPELSAA
jgi:hypothetical protein